MRSNPGKTPRAILTLRPGCFSGARSCFKPIDDDCANATIGKLLYLHLLDSKRPISLMINSVGGSIRDFLTE